MAFPGAHPPDRTRAVNSSGLRIAVHEWGDPDAPPLMVAHGGFDFSRTLDVFAPLLAAGGWRVVAWDQRGHGDSDHALLYSWDADLRDAAAVFASTSPAPMPALGHSKGGELMMHLADASPHLITTIINLDGLPSREARPDIADHDRTRMLSGELNSWLDWRRSASNRERKPDTLEGLAKRRAKMNPRLPKEWLEYLVTVGGREDADGWRWKLDPVMRFGGFGPWRPEWILERMRGLPVPMLAVLATVKETMGWPTTAEGLRPFLPDTARLVAVEDTGHFVHIERPRYIADLALEYLR
jgi:pimeloyl-ACP methyl ester carboxylesterase